MSIFKVSFFADGYERVAVVIQTDEERAIEFLKKNYAEFELISIDEINPYIESIIHEEVIEMV
ncbi:hypothetical protein [Pallidibacillus thermolactis]|uniref:hypothetical protein n=1 Tax=Pallidibacillus thermolactis TaxID=251051 RepID=UPI0021D82B8D|nr:hypothetical protein [Pallidibacillus thermolactis]MCU9601740.1 hypothetical protein [Pallidibacillus thermolactis subsp. kokeshiiformis]